MTRVYGLKRATPRMNYVHMNHVIQWREQLADLTANPPDRHVALKIIHQAIGVDFENWYSKVYALRRDNRNDEYEAAIFKKLKSIQRAEKRRARKEASDKATTTTR